MKIEPFPSIHRACIDQSRTYSTPKNCVDASRPHCASLSAHAQRILDFVAHACLHGENATRKILPIPSRWDRIVHLPCPASDCSLAFSVLMPRFSLVWNGLHVTCDIIQIIRLIYREKPKSARMLNYFGSNNASQIKKGA